MTDDSQRMADLVSGVRLVLSDPRTHLGTKEENVKAKIVIPVLELLGVDLFADALFELDTPVGAPDVFLRFEDRPFALIEVKRWGDDVPGRDRERFRAYRAGTLPSPPPLAVLTTGKLWELWRREADVPEILKLSSSFPASELEALQRRLGVPAARAFVENEPRLCADEDWRLLANRPDAGRVWSEDDLGDFADAKLASVMLERLRAIADEFNLNLTWGRGATPAVMLKWPKQGSVFHLILTGHGLKVGHIKKAPALAREAGYEELWDEPAVVRDLDSAEVVLGKLALLCGDLKAVSGR